LIGTLDYAESLGSTMADENDADRRSSLQAWVLPIVTGLIGILAGLATATVTRLNSNDLLAKDYVSMAVDILKLPAKEDKQDDEDSKRMRLELRRWAVQVINSYAKVQMSPELASYLASANGKRLLLQIVDDSKTDTGVLMCSSASESGMALEFAKSLSGAIVASGKFGSSYISEWKDEGPLTSLALKGSVTIVKDKGHPEESSVPDLASIIQGEQKRLGLDIPIKIADNPSAKKSEWFLAVVVCP